MAVRYWVGGPGTWDTTSTAHWSASSGGAGGASVPTSADDVVFDGNSGSSCMVTPNDLSGAVACRDLTFVAGFDGLVLQGYGSGMVVNCYGNYRVAAGAGGVRAESAGFKLMAPGAVTVDTNGVPHGDITFAGGGTYTLLSDLVGGMADAETTFQLTAGTLDVAGKTIRVDRFQSTGATAREVKFTGGGTMDLGDMAASGVSGLTLSGSNWTWDAAKTGTLKIRRADSFAISGGTPSFGAVLLAPAEQPVLLAFPGGSYIKSLSFDGSGQATQDVGISLPTAGTVTVEAIQVLSGAAKAARVKINSTTPGTKGNLTVFSATRIKPDNLTLKDVAVSSGPLLAGGNAVNGGNCSGVFFGKKLPGMGAIL